MVIVDPQSVKNGESGSDPIGSLGIIAMPGCEALVSMIDTHLLAVRRENGTPPIKNTFQVPVSCPRFGTGEGKAIIGQSVRGYDIYIVCDVFNHGVTFNMYSREVPMSPDDHFQDLKRVIAAIGTKARRVTVIMPMLYEGRQHRRGHRESLDCAIALQELKGMGVSCIITVDAHDPRVQNAIPMDDFEDVHPTYQMIKALINTVPDLKLDPEHAIIISPDEGGMGRCLFYSSALKLDLGMFYKRRDYSKLVNGRNPIVAHEFLGDSVAGKDLIIVDDMISTGDSIIDLATQLRQQGAQRVFVFASFGLFTEGVGKMTEAYEKGLITKIFTTNLIYRSDELKSAPWYCEVDMSKFMGLIIETLNRDKSTTEIMNPSMKIEAFLKQHGF